MMDVGLQRQVLHAMRLSRNIMIVKMGAKQLTVLDNHRQHGARFALRILK